MIDFFDPRTEEEKELSVMIEFFEAKGDLDQELIKIQKHLSAAYRELCRCGQIRMLYGLLDKGDEYFIRTGKLIEDITKSFDEYFKY